MRSALVLCFHAVECAESRLAIEPAALERHVATLRGRGFCFTTAGRLAAGGEGRRAAVTFDDGYETVLDALPVLESLGVPATVFPITGLVGGEAVLRGTGKRRLLSWDQLRTLVAAGWEVGSHTRTHPVLTDLYGDELERELVESRERIESELGTSCRSLAYPYGAADDRVSAAARRAGYCAGFTVPRRWARDEPLLHPRVTVWRNDRPATVSLKSSRLVRAVRSTRLGAAALATAGRTWQGAER
jgi:peptidoglycan/xylan/chitin deacetylase (PgdA/CDA1 family)